MRLIDADKLEEFIDVGHLRSPCELCFSENDVIWIVRKRPTVDAMPVVHGKWLHDESGANFCSQCMKYVYEDEEYHMILHTKFCPHCGAKMDEKEGGQDE